jgi:hypothetical protein
MAQLLDHHVQHLPGKIPAGLKRSRRLGAHQGEFAHPALQGGDDFLGRTLTDALQPAERLHVAVLDRPRDPADGKRHGFHGLQGADVLDTDETLEKLLFDIVIEADQNGFGLALSLLVIDMQSQLVADVLVGQRFHDHGRHEDLIAHLVGEDEDAVVIFLENLALKVPDHGAVRPMPPGCSTPAAGRGAVRGQPTGRCSETGRSWPGRGHLMRGKVG